MADYVLYIQGTAVPYTSAIVSAELGEMAAVTDALGNSGNHLRVIGNPVKGFSLRKVTEALEESPELPVIIINAHGNVDSGKHYIKAQQGVGFDEKRDGRIFASDLYGVVTDQAYGQGVNIFMLSCGSGNGCGDAIRELPFGSTVVNLTTSDQVFSFGLKPRGFDIKAEMDSSYSEDLFLNILCSGFGNKRDKTQYLPGNPENINYQPQLTVRNELNPYGKTWNMWELARRECFGRLTADKATINEIKEKLGRFVSEDRIQKALLFMSAYSSSDGRGISAGGHLRISPQHLMAQAVEQEVLGPICAIAYMLRREDIGAFNREPARMSADVQGRAAKTFDF